MRPSTAIALTLGASFLLAPAADAGPALLIDASNGKVLYAEDHDDLWHPASLTKIMTAYLTFEALKAGKFTVETKIPVSEGAHEQPPSKLGLPVGAELSVQLALQALIVKSANDVAVMLAEAVGGTQAAFVEQMNATASRLGMTRTKFVNPNGLPAAEQVTTARDMAKLSRAALRDFPEYVHYWALADMRMGRQRIGTHNQLLKTYDGADGMKTGFICDSGYNVVASATRDGIRLMAIVLGENSGRERGIRTKSLLQHGFVTYGWKTYFNAQALEDIPISADARSISSLRQTVMATECGNRRRVPTVAERQKAKQAKAIKAKADAKDAGTAAGEAAARKAPASSPAKPSQSSEGTGPAKAKPKEANASAPAKGQ